MLFEVWKLEHTDAWADHPFNGNGNANGIFTDPALDSGTARETIASGWPPREKTAEGLKNPHHMGEKDTSAQALT